MSAITKGGQGREPEDMLGAAVVCAIAAFGVMIVAVVVAVWGAR